MTVDGSDPIYMHGDHLQSTSNTSGDTTSGTQYYYPYGDMRGGSEVATDYRYTGQRWQSALGLYYYRARWYDPQMRRFIQADTLVPEPGNPQTLNRYAYANNSPIMYADPDGHFGVLAAIGVAALVGGVASAAVDVGMQVFLEDKSLTNVDLRRTGGAAIGGAVAGATMALMAPATVGGLAVAGAASTVLGGQAQALGQASIEQLAADELDQETVASRASHLGFLKGDRIVQDAVTGAVVGVAQGVVSPKVAQGVGVPKNITKNVVDRRLPVIRSIRGLDQPTHMGPRLEGWYAEYPIPPVETIGRAVMSGAYQFMDDFLWGATGEGLDQALDDGAMLP